MTDYALALALVRSHLASDEQYLSWVSPYTKIRWAHMADGSRVVAERVGGHWRRKPHCKRTTEAITCVCKMPNMDVVPRARSPGQSSPPGPQACSQSPPSHQA